MVYNGDAMINYLYCKIYHNCLHIAFDNREKETIEFKLNKSTNEIIMCPTKHCIINYSIYINCEHIECIPFIRNRQNTEIEKLFHIYNFVEQYSLPYREIADIYIILRGL